MGWNTVIITLIVGIFCLMWGGPIGWIAGLVCIIPASVLGIAYAIRGAPKG